MKEALLYESLDRRRVRCRLCAHYCVIAEGCKGHCAVRQNHGGRLYTLVYGRTIARHADAIEKKPLFHFQPGSRAYSMATPGCNFRCAWCQNCEISQMPREQRLRMGQPGSPGELAAEAERAGCRSMAYTYTEPTVFFEYAQDTARAARERGLANVFVTNGYMTSEMLEGADAWLDAASVDLKGFRDESYRQYAHARLKPVLRSLRDLKQRGIWVEVTTLIVPGINDSDEELRDVARFLKDELGPETPWHVSRFFPAYRMRHLPPTPLDRLERAQEIGREEGLWHVYGGNCPGEANTACRACGHTLIRRSGFDVFDNVVAPDGTCPRCATVVAGVEMSGPCNDREA